MSGERSIATYNGVGVYGSESNSESGAGVPCATGTPVELTDVGVRVKVGEGPGVRVGSRVTWFSPGMMNPNTTAPMMTAPSKTIPPKRATGLARTAANPFSLGFSCASKSLSSQVRGRLIWKG